MSAMRSAVNSGMIRVPPTKLKPRNSGASKLTGKPAADEKDRKRSIESVDVAGNAAVAKVILDYPNVRFVDYFTLLKINGEWKIVNKSFYADPKKTQ